MNYLLSLLILGGSLLGFGGVPSLEVRVDNVRSAKGCIRLAVFADSADFAMRKNALYISRIPLDAQGPQVVFQLPQLERGRYAIAAYHDQNNNDELDTNLLGIPAEPYGFGREPDSKWRAPRWEEVAIDYRPGMTTLQLDLKTWSER